MPPSVCKPEEIIRVCLCNIIIIIISEYLPIRRWHVRRISYEEEPSGGTSINYNNNIYTTLNRVKCAGDCESGQSLKNIKSLQCLNIAKA